MSFLFSNRSSKTFKPKKNIPEGSHQHELMKHANATLGSGNEGEERRGPVVMAGSDHCDDRKSEASCHVARGGGSQRVDCRQHGGLLQSDQHVIWDHH